MPIRLIFMAASLAVGTLIASAANAAPGWATGSVNMRTCPSTSCGRITTIPAGASVQVYSCNGWCDVAYGGYRGWASSGYISFGSYAPPLPPPPRIYVTPPRPYYWRRPPPPPYWRRPPPSPGIWFRF